MIYIVRHGESLSNKNRRYSGITDVELSPHGFKQAKVAGLNLKKYQINKIYSSPLKRAYHTAKKISNIIDFNEKDIEIDERLMEINFGAFENKTWDELVVSYKAETDIWASKGLRYKFPMGESLDEIILRISDFLDKIEDNSLIVTHFGVIQAIFLYFQIADYDNLSNYHISNCDIIVLNNKKIIEIIKCK